MVQQWYKRPTPLQTFCQAYAPHRLDSGVTLLPRATAKHTLLEIPDLYDDYPNLFDYTRFLVNIDAQGIQHVRNVNNPCSMFWMPTHQFSYDNCLWPMKQHAFCYEMIQQCRGLQKKDAQL